MAEHDGKISRTALLAMVVGGMVGAGIFALPSRFAGVTGPIGAVIAWIIAGTGMYMLARVFQFLGERKPDLDAGVFAYAKEGFGDYPGFLSAFGYWVGSCIGNVSYWVLIKSTLGAFFPVFGDGNTVTAIIVAVIGIWLFHYLIMRGTQQATAVNKIVTIAKVVPIVVFLLLLLVYFKLDLFRYNLYGGDLTTGVFEQVRATMLVTVFVFLGIEGASVYSRYANERSDIGFATIMGFIIVTSLMVLVTLLPFAVLQRAEIAGQTAPSMAGVLEAVVGPWGRVFISVGVIVSVLGAYLAWTLICAEVLSAAARNKDMPSVFAKENANKVPVAALVLTNMVVTVIVITTYWSRDAFNLMLDLTAAVSLIPFLLCAGYGWMMVARGETYDARPEGRTRDLWIAVVATLYCAFLVFAAGLEFVVLSAVLYGPGTVLYFWSRREQGLPVFTKTTDWVIFILAVIGAIVGIYWIATGYIQI